MRRPKEFEATLRVRNFALICKTVEQAEEFMNRLEALCKEYVAKSDNDYFFRYDID